VQTTTSSVYYQTTGLRHQIESVIDSILYMTAFFELQRWVKEKGTGGRTIEYKPALPIHGAKRGMAIEAKNLTFAYPGTKSPVLKDINLKIDAGETLAIVGFNGGGKTFGMEGSHSRLIPFIRQDHSGEDPHWFV
jgi:ABC-type multidrug transport system fused ATPase/permease subunit